MRNELVNHVRRLEIVADAEALVDRVLADLVFAEPAEDLRRGEAFLAVTVAARAAARMSTKPLDRDRDARESVGIEIERLRLPCPALCSTEAS